MDWYSAPWIRNLRHSLVQHRHPLPPSCIATLHPFPSPNLSHPPSSQTPTIADKGAEEVYRLAGVTRTYRQHDRVVLSSDAVSARCSAGVEGGPAPRQSAQ